MAVSFGVFHASADPQASISANPEASGTDGFAAFEGADGARSLFGEERLNTEKLSGAAAVDVIDEAVADATGSGGCEDTLAEPPEKSKRSALGCSAALLLVMFALEFDEKKSPKPPVELIVACFLAGAFEAGGSKKEPPEPNPDDVKLARLLLFDEAAKFDTGFDGAGVEPKLRPLNASAIPLDGECSCANGSGP